MGRKVKEFEALFADYIGVKHAVMVNSGSSANLLALAILTNPQLTGHFERADEVITPAVTWATTVFPILNMGLLPVLVDVDVNSFNIIPDEVESAITSKTRAIMLVHLLGNPCNMDSITDIARRHNLVVIEDACEAHGAEYRGKKVGSFGDLATFSFFFSHHINTIEGGMVLTDREEYAEMARGLRAFGWIRDLKDRQQIATRSPGLDPRFLFTNIGYNLRPTEIQGGIGIHQIQKLEGFIEARRQNSTYWDERIGAHDDYFLLHSEAENTRHVWFGYPITLKPGTPFTRADVVEFLESKNVETRPIMAGNIDEQPVMRHYPYRPVGDLPNARWIMRNSFLFGNHQGIGQLEREAIADYFDEFVGRYKKL
jgi:CDP-6-deoxy-D-xylo-4-hexulose-3-dehydrase